ncbi:hypothetical protein JCM10213_008868 [Rhodosporidiobolus nylandii]
MDPLVVKDDNSDSELPYLSNALDAAPLPALPPLAFLPSPSRRISKPRKPTSSVHSFSLARRTSGAGKKPSVKERLAFKEVGAAKRRGSVKRGLGGFTNGVKGSVGKLASGGNGRGNGWGDSSDEDEKAPTEPPAKRRMPFWPSRPQSKRRDSSSRQQQTKAARHSVSSGSSFVFVQAEEAPTKGSLQFYRDKVEEESEDDGEAKTPTMPISAPLSDAETTGENMLRRPPPPLSYPRLPLAAKLVSPPETAKPQKKRFKLPSLPPPPVDSGPLSTDVDFDLELDDALEAKIPETSVELAGGQKELLGAPALSEGSTSFRGEEKQDDDDDRPLTARPPEPSSAGGTSGGEWINALLTDYDRTSLHDDSDAASTASSDAPLGAKYPRQLPILAALPAFVQTAQGNYPLPLPSPTHSPCAASFFDPHFPPPSPSGLTQSAAVPWPSLAPPPSVYTTASRRVPPAPLLNLHAAPPVPAWRTQQPGKHPGSPGLIGHVKGKDLPQRVEGARDPVKEKWEAEGRRREASARKK